MLRRWLSLVVIAGAAFAAGGAATRYAARRHDGERERQARLLRRAVEMIRRNYVDSIPGDSLYLKATDGLVHSLNDPYAELLLECIEPPIHARRVHAQAARRGIEPCRA